MPAARLLAVPCLLGAVLALAGCGGGEDEREEVNAAIADSATSRDPADCLRLATLRFLEQTTKRQGEAAVRQCEADTLEGDSVPERVTARAIAVEGGEATAEVAFVGSDFDGQTLRIALVEEDGVWKLDEILAFAEFDRDKMELGIGRSVYEESRSEVELQYAECILARVEALDDRSLEALVLDPSPTPIIELAQSCAPRSQAI